MDLIASSRAPKRQLLIRLVIYLVLAAASVVLYHLLFSGLIALLAPQVSIPALRVLAVVFLGSVFLVASIVIQDVVQSRLIRRHTSIRRLIPRLSDEIAQCREVSELAQRVLAIVQREFLVDDVQLTFYYDQPFALEVTHLRRTGDRMQRVIARVREDEPDAQSEEEEVLTPMTAEHTEVLTHRDRLVGLLLLGPTGRRKGYTADDLELFGEIAPVISSGADQVMMIRHINETNQRLFESDKLISIGQLASGIAHEIRNPLTSMRMNLQGLKRRGKLEEKDKKRVQICLDEIIRLDNIISEIMQFARRTKLEVAPVKAKHIVTTALEMTRQEMESRGIDVVTQIQPSLPTIRADENRLIRALINLLINAAQAMGHGGTITVYAEAYGTGVEIAVTDQGPGIAKELRRDIFNPFFTTKADGTGLGLANALKFVQEHGGELDFITEMEVGTTFSIRLPPQPPAHLDDPSALRVVPT
ncbi:MAG: ATP-binding protein [bacterium]